MEMLPRGLLHASWYPREVSEISRDTNIKMHPRPGCQGLSRSLWHEKAKVRVRFLYNSRLLGWFLLF